MQQPPTTTNLGAMDNHLDLLGNYPKLRDHNAFPLIMLPPNDPQGSSPPSPPSLSLYLSICLSRWLTICLFLFLHSVLRRHSVFLHLSQSLPLSVRLSICLRFWLPVCMTLNVSSFLGYIRISMVGRRLGVSMTGNTVRMTGSG